MEDDVGVGATVVEIRRVSDRQGKQRLVDLPEAASLLHLSVEGVQALVGAGFLRPSVQEAEEPRFALGDLKAFVARNADDGADALFGEEGDAVDPQALVQALDGRSEEMARRAFDIFSAAFTEAREWPLREQARFIGQARKRFEAILAVTSQGEAVDEALVGDLEEVGAGAAWTESPLPQLLLVLRISRDLVVQTAVEVAEERGRHWGLALSLLLTRVLPAVDRLTDAVARGYWRAMIGREEESLARYQHVVEGSSDGIFEVDLDGRIQYANPSLAVIFGRPLDRLLERPLGDLLVPLESSTIVDRLLTEPEEGVTSVEAAVARADGVRRVLDISTRPRHREGSVVGFSGVVRDITAQADLERAKNEFLALVTNDLRNPLATILGLGATLETYGQQVEAERVQKIGASVRRQAERMARLADDLYDISRLEARSLVLNLREVDLAGAVELALDSVAGLSDALQVDVRVPPETRVLADGRRLEQVVANLVENAVVHGRGPVVLEVEVTNGKVELEVRDQGPGVPSSLVPTLFSRLRTFSRSDRDPSRGTGLGLALVRGLVEAMGGRVWYEDAPDGGACFRVVLQAA